VYDSSVLLGVFLAALVLSTLVRVLAVSHSIQVSEWLSFDAGRKSWGGLGHDARSGSKWDVGELRLANLFVGASKEGFNHLRSGTVLSQVILSWVLVRITESIALKASKCGLAVLASVHRHSSVQTHLVSLLAESLIASARVSYCEANRH